MEPIIDCLRIPFAGDYHLAVEIARLIREYNINLLIETGTYIGSSTLALAELCKKVITIESDVEYYDLANKLFKESHKKNILSILGNSPKVLNLVFTNIEEKNLLVFLDAHWEENWPLLEELSTIQKHNLQPVIILHDVYNPLPGCEDFGFDSYNGNKLDLGYIKQSLDNIYGKDNYSYYYNSKASGKKVGVLFVLPYRRN